MLILAFESSAKAASVAISCDGVIADEAFRCDGLTHSETLLPMAEQLLARNSLRVQDFDIIAVAQGPGSFTGIRIGVSTVKGLSWASEVPCLGVSTLEAMALTATLNPEACPLAPGGIICCCMDARRGQVYNALFEVTEDGIKRLCADRAIALEELIPEVSALPAPVLLMGDGAAITAAAFEQAGLRFNVPGGEAVYQRASGVCKAAEGKQGYSSQDLLPVYLRLSQAERERQERLKI